MSRSLFVSDIHLASTDDPKHKMFADFLDRCAAIPLDHLFLVGDIFDLWVADQRFFVERYHRIIERLERLKSLGAEIHYFEGNHDLDLKLFWHDQLGFDVHDSAAYFKLGPLRVRVEHGDQMDPDDRGYLFLRWFLRTKAMRALGRTLPGAAVKWIGSRASHASRDYTTQIKTASDDEVRAKIRNHASKAYREKAFDLFVSGHVHVREDSQQEHFRCINLGTWLKEPLVLDVNDAHIRLKTLDQFLQGQ